MKHKKSQDRINERLSNIVDETKINKHYSNSEKNRAKNRKSKQIFDPLVRQETLKQEFENIKISQKETSDWLNEVKNIMQEKCGYYEESYQIMELTEHLKNKMKEFEKLTPESFLDDKKRLSEHFPERRRGVSELNEMTKEEENLIIAQNEYLFHKNALARHVVEIDRMNCLQQADTLRKLGFRDEFEKVQNKTNALIARQLVRESPRPFRDKDFEQ